MRSVRIGFVQMRVSFGKVEKNIERGMKIALSLKEPDLIVFPELFNTGYAFLDRREVLKLSEDLNGKTVKAILDLSREVGSCVVAGIAEREEERVFNSAVIALDGEILGIYRKIHLFFKEKEWFNEGDLGFRVFKTPKFKLGVMICFDWIFPEAARTLALKGAEIIAHPSNLVLPYAQNAMLTRSIENRVYTITANRIGAEKRGGLEFRFTGGSQITAPDMRLIHRASENSEEGYCAEIDVSKARDKKVTPLNDVIGDRKTQFYFR